MGLVVDSGVLIYSERREVPVRTLLEDLRRRYGATECILSAVSVVELEHGLYRATSPSIAARRKRYVDSVLDALPVEPFTRAIGGIAAQMGAEAALKGDQVPFADLLIGATALYLGYSVVTRNPTDFRKIAGLDVHDYQPI